MTLLIKLDGNNIDLSLLDGDKVLGELAWVGEHSLSELLLSKIDELLQENKVAKEAVQKIETQISATSGVTSSRIVETVARAWNVKMQD